MMLTAYAQATQEPELHIWVGVFDAPSPPQPTFVVRGKATPAQGQLQPIRDGWSHQGQPLNHHGRFVLQPAAAESYDVEVRAGNAQPFRFTTRRLPAALPAGMDGSFNLLLSSCYYQPRDAGGLARAVASLAQRPHLTLLAGDQVYGDLPLHSGPPRSAAAIRADLGAKYRLNWASSALGAAGLGEVLARAPVVCVPDDHEFWNNYPFRQAQLADSYWPSSRRAWELAARELFDDYQRSAASATGATRLDVGPLKMLFLDMRSERDNDYRQLMGAPAWAGFDAWVADLLAAPDGVGLLSSGQALLMDKPGAFSKHVADAEMPNYEEYERLLAGLARLADARVPLLYVTGDVHWGRMAEVADAPSGQVLLHEVIASPSVLIDSPLDGITVAKNKLANAADPWPRHGKGDDVPKLKFGPGGRFQARRTCAVPGDQVAVLAFSRNGGGVDCEVTYYAIHPDPKLSAPRTQPAIHLNRF